MLKCGLFGGFIVVVRSLMDVGEFIVVVAGGAFSVGAFVGWFFLKGIIVVVTF